MFCPHCSTRTNILPAEELGVTEQFCPQCLKSLTLPSLLKAFVDENPSIYADTPSLLDKISYHLFPGHLTIGWISLLIKEGACRFIWNARQLDEQAFLEQRVNLIQKLKEKTHLHEDLVAQGLHIFCEGYNRPLPKQPLRGTPLYNTVQLAQAGNAEAQETVGFSYMQGWSVEKNETLGFQWMKAAATQNLPSAQRRLAGYYLTGAGIDPDTEKALEYTISASEQGDVIACSNLGVFYKERDKSSPNHSVSLECWLTAAKAGNPIAQCHLGDYFRFEDSSSHHEELALYWYRKAAENDCPEANCSLAFCYDDGFGVPENEQISLYYYKIAANHGLSQAQFHLATCYEFGYGTEIDLAKSHQWYMKSAIQGNTESYVALANWIHQDISMEENTQMMLYWCQKAAQHGNPEACYHLGIQYAYQKEDKEAIQWLKRAVEGNHSLAMCYLASCYQWGIGIENNFTHAMKLLTLAAENKEETALIQLSFAYETGFGVEQDSNLAMKHQESLFSLALSDETMKIPILEEQRSFLSKSSNHENYDPEEYLSAATILYESSFPLNIHLKLAFFWLYKAAFLGNIEAQMKLHCYANNIQANPEQDARWYLKAAFQGYPMAQLQLGRCYEEGNGVIEKAELAFYWYKKAALQDLPQAQICLSECYSTGYGTSVNLDASSHWYACAIENGYVDEEEEF